MKVSPFAVANKVVIVFWRRLLTRTLHSRTDCEVTEILICSNGTNLIGWVTHAQRGGVKFASHIRCIAHSDSSLMWSESFESLPTWFQWVQCWLRHDFISKCVSIPQLLMQILPRASVKTFTRYSTKWAYKHGDGNPASSGLKILTLCLSLGQWESLIRPWPANERRQVDGSGRRGAKRKAISGNDYRLISLFILPLKREGETRTFPPTPIGPTLIV